MAFPKQRTGQKSGGKILAAILCLNMMSATGCILGIKSRNIEVFPAATRAKYSVPYSVKVKFEDVAEKYGPIASAFILNTKNLEESFTRFLAFRNTFQKGNIKIIERNYSDLILKARIADLALRNTMRGFVYEVSIEAWLRDRDDNSLGTYEGKYSFTAKINSRFTAKTDNLYINHIVNVAFDEICEKIESAFENKRVSPVIKLPSGEEKTALKGVLTEALNSASPAARREAIRDLSAGFSSGWFDLDQDTMKGLLSKFEDSAAEVRHEAVKALGALGKNSELVRRQLVAVLQSDAAGTKFVYAALSMADIGPEALEHVPALLELIPKIQDVTETYSDYLDLSVMSGKDDRTLDSFYGSGEDWARLYPYETIIREKVADRMGGGMGFSRTEAAFIASSLLGAIIDNSREADRKRSESKRIGQRLMESYSRQFKSRFGKHLGKLEISEKFAGPWENTLFETVITYNLAAVSYSLTKLTGVDFQSDQKKWREWWEENKGKISMKKKNG